MQRAYERGIKWISMIDMASITSSRRHDKQQDKWTNKKANKARKQANKQAKIQKVVSMRDKCRFG